jgi:hypothetical protein
MHVGTLENVQYDMIIGNDLLEALKIDLKYSTATIVWEAAEIPMRSRDATVEDSYYINDTPCLTEAAERIKEILDAKYEPANLDEITANCTHLTTEQQEQLNTLLKNIKTYSMEHSDTGKGKITILNYAVTQHRIMRVLSQFLVYTNKPYDKR